MLVIGFCLVWRGIQISVQSVVYAVGYFEFYNVYHFKIEEDVGNEESFVYARTFLMYKKSWEPKTNESNENVTVWSK